MVGMARARMLATVDGYTSDGRQGGVRMPATVGYMIDGGRGMCAHADSWSDG